MVNVKDTLYQVYLYLVLSVSLAFGAAQLGGMVLGGASVFYPQVMISKHQWEKIHDAKDNKREEVKERIFALEKHNGFSWLFRCLLRLFIILPIFFIHAILLFMYRRRK